MNTTITNTIPEPIETIKSKVAPYAYPKYLGNAGSLSKGGCSSSLGLFHWNFQGLGTAFNELECELKNHPECTMVCITEHWKTEEELKVMAIENFKLISSFCRDKGKHGGSAVYIKCEPLKKLTNLSISGIFECAAVECNIDGTVCIVASVYRPSGSGVNMFFDRLELFLISTREYKFDCILLAGDFNIHIEYTNKDRTDFINQLASFGLHHTVNEMTRIIPESESCLDNICTNIMKFKSSVVRMHLSDHTAQKLTFAVQTTRENVREYTRFFNEEAKQTFISRLREQDWKTVYSVDEGEVNEQWNNFSSEFFRQFDECFPLK